MTRIGMLVSLRGVNVRFSMVSLRCSGQNATDIQPFSFRVACEEIEIYVSIYVLIWSLGVNKSLGHAQIGLLQGTKNLKNERANEQNKSTGTWQVLISKCKGLKRSLQNSGRARRPKYLSNVSMVYKLRNHARCWQNTRRICKPRAAGEWFTNSSSVLPTSQVVYQLITHRNLWSIAFI